MKLIHTVCLLLAAALASAQTLKQQLNDCAQIDADSERLACYDDLTQASPKTPVSKPRTNHIPELIADLDESNLFISYGQLDFLGNEFNAVLLGGGKRQKVRSFQLTENRSVDFNVFGQIRSQFDVDELDTRNNRGGALINTDFSVGGEVVQSLDHWNWRLSYTHRSTHLGDEFIIDNQEYLTERLNLSYEVVEWLAHTRLNAWDVYAGVGLVTRSEPGNLGKVSWQLGWQYLGDRWHGIKPVWAVDLKSWSAADWNINVNMRAGVEIDQWSETPFQLLFEYHDGHSPYGQFYLDDLTFMGLTFLQNW